MSIPLPLTLRAALDAGTYYVEDDACHRVPDAVYDALLAHYRQYTPAAWAAATAVAWGPPMLAWNGVHVFRAQRGS